MGDPAQSPDFSMLNLTAAMIDSGSKVETVSGNSNPLVRRIVNFRTPYQFEKSCRFLKRYDYVIVLLGTLNSPSYRSKSVSGKIKERIRMGVFLKQLKAHGRKIFLVGSKLDQLRAGILSASDAQVFPENQMLPSILHKINQQIWRPMDVTVARQTVLEHANFQDNDGKFTARKLKRFLAGTNSKDADLKAICSLAEQVSDRKVSLVKRILSCPTNVPESVKRSKIPLPALSLATTLDKSNNLPKYALHLLSVLKPDQKFDLATPTGQKQALEWYHSTAREQLPEYWIPLEHPPADFIQEDTANSEANSLEAFLNEPCNDQLLSPELRRLLSTKSTSTGPTGLAILMALLCRIQVDDNDIKAPWTSAKIAKWFSTRVCALEPDLERYATKSSPKPTQTIHADIIGQKEQETGLGLNMRVSIQAIDKIGLCYRTRNLDDSFSATPHTQSSPLKPKQNFALHHVNADRIPMNIMTPQYAHRNDTYHIGFCLWETSQLPKNHLLGIEMLDEVWAPTRFVETLYKNAGAKVVTKVGKALQELPYLHKMAEITPNDPKHFTVFTGFDFHSSVERKNPMAVVEAFRIAFPKTMFKDAKLVVKTTPSVAKHWGDPNEQMAQIRNAASDDPRIEILEQMLPLQYLFKLMARADCIVSAHRGEGFGYIPAYGLALKKPVIVTNWGGVKDFCTSDTSFPVSAKLVDVPIGHSIYDAPGAQWADVDPSDIASQLYRIYHDPGLAKKRASEGQKLVQMMYSPEQLAETYRTRLTQIGLI
jgi:glycosyltransferase involved in cell wall biosynthesis